jgi:hypothetical protein
MPQRVKKAFATHADIYWDGAPPPDFRPKIEAILKRELTDDEWGLFCYRVLTSYSIALNLEHATVSLSEQKTAARDLQNAVNRLREAVSNADKMEMGVIVRNRIAKTWDEVYPREAEYDRHRDKMVDDIAYLLEASGHNAARDQADQTVGDWEARGIIFRPSQPADFLVDLEQFKSAVDKFVGGLDDGTEYFEVEGWAFVSLVGNLTEWLKEQGFSSSASKNESTTGGKITAIAKAINDLIPDLPDANDGINRGQLRRPTVQDATLAAQIIRAQQQYEQARLSHLGTDKV